MNIVCLATGADWKLGKISIRSSTPFQIVFQGRVGGYLGDIAIDDINVSDGLC